jgi:DNA polymerase elongation subunit (family B)
MSLKNKTDIKRPVSTQFNLINNKDDLEVYITDYSRCIDLFTEPTNEDDQDTTTTETFSNSSEDSDDDISTNQNIYSKESQKDFSYKHPMLIKAHGILKSGHSITINLQNFQPFFYIKIPDDWEKKDYQHFIVNLKKIVYYKYKSHLTKSVVVIRKPFTKFTGNDKFKYFKLQFLNKESYDEYQRKLEKPLKIHGLNGNALYKYDLYESNIDPLIKFIHMTKINPSGWIMIPKSLYTIIKKNERTSFTNYEIIAKWDIIMPIDRMELAVINVASFDIEADSSHGDFPIGIKNYQKLAQDLVTLYNQCGIPAKRSKIHRSFQKSPQNIVKRLLELVFDDHFNNDGIHQILTCNNLKPHPETLDQIAYSICQLVDQLQAQIIDQDQMILQLTDIFELNFPHIDLLQENNSHYELMSKEISIHISHLLKTNNNSFKKDRFKCVLLMLQLGFDDYYDGFVVNRIYTKFNDKPDPILLNSLVPDIIQILHECAQYVHFKKLPTSGKVVLYDGVSYNEDTISQDAFVKKITQLFDKNLPSVEGDKLIQIGTTFQLTGHSDCYLKHIICLGKCDEITTTETINDENCDIYLPVEDLAKDITMYDNQLESRNMTPEQLSDAIKEKSKQIKTWDIAQRKIQCKKAAEYRRIKQTMTDKSIVIVEYYDNERDLLMAWKELMILNDPDVVIGYNIFGFDFKFLYERSKEMGCDMEFCQLGKLKQCTEHLYEQKLSSSGLGDNTLKYIPMCGRVLIDLYKVIQKDYRLDSYKLDSVCHKFLYKEKLDISPQEIFILQKGSSTDRKKIARYCLIDCVLCNRLLEKMELLGNNIAMSNVCKVPLPYLFLRGQGVKLFSLVADFCDREGYLIPVLAKADETTDDGYEGAIVLKPFTGIHFEPIAVADFNSLYPSSMISENLSHDSFVEIGGKYDNLPGFTYVDIEYDMYKWVTHTGKKKKFKQKVGVQKCRYAQLPNGKKSILPSILMWLLATRKATKKQMESEKDPFKVKILDGRQQAYKVTANSLYGQCGAKTSPISKVEIAASTTAVGRQMIMFSKKHIETEYKNAIIELDLNNSGIYDEKSKQVIPSKYTGKIIHVKDSYCVYGDTDSVFIKFGMFTLEGEKISGMDAVFISMAICKRASKEISSQLKKPQNLEMEKVIYPFMLFNKKRYHGHYYTKMDNPSFYPNSMGIALKRRDNAPIVKTILGGAIDIIMKDHDVDKSLDFVKTSVSKLLKGGYNIEDFLISKTLRSYYKKPNQIAHNVLANRQAQRDPGNKFQSNDRVPYAFIIHPNPSKDHLQGDKIETPEFIKQNRLLINYKMYLTNQIIKPVSQIFELVKGFENIGDMFDQMIANYENDRCGAIRLDNFFMKWKKNEKTCTSIKLSTLIEQLKTQDVEIDNENLVDDVANDDDDDEVDIDTCDHDDVDESLYQSNYDDPSF